MKQTDDNFDGLWEERQEIVNIEDEKLIEEEEEEELECICLIDPDHCPIHNSSEDEEE